MPSFGYQAIDTSGRRVSGEVSADSKLEALDMVSAKGLIPIKVAEGSSAEPWWNRDIAFFGGTAVTPVELERFLLTLAAMLFAKTPLPRALRFCADVTTNKAMKTRLTEAVNSVEDGGSLADALSRHGAFPDSIVTMIRLGERSNSLDQVVDRLAKSLEIEVQLRRDLSQALIYPILLLSMSVFVLSVLVFYLAPNLAPVFSSGNSDPPFVIAVMVRLNQMITDHWPFVLSGGLIGLLALYTAAPVIRRMVQPPLQVLPFVRRYIAKRESLRLCQTLDLMLSNGGQLTDAIRLATQATPMQNWQAMLEKMQTNIEAGQSLTVALADNRLLDPMVRTILMTGDESDMLLDVLPKSRRMLQSQTSQTLSQAVKLLTPLLTLVIGVTVGAIILSTISAIMDLNDVVF